MQKTNRAIIKRSVLNALKAAVKPITVGDLFLITEYSQPMILKVLRELRDEGLVASEIRETTTRIYSGNYVSYKASHWWLVKPVSRSRLKGFTHQNRNKKSLSD